MEIVIASRRRRLSKLEAAYPGAAVVDITSKGPEPWIRFSQAYRWVLENRLVGDVEQLRQIARKQTLMLLDYETNTDVDDLSSPLSHARSLKSHLESAWPE